MDLLDTFWMELPHARSYGGSGMFCGILSGRFIQVSGLSGAQRNGNFIFFSLCLFSFSQSDLDRFNIQTEKVWGIVVRSYLCRLRYFPLV
jgi:hypothetical protein